MQREGHSYLPNMRAIQCNLAMIGRNVSNPSPHASYMMDGIFLWRRETRREARMRVRNAHWCVRGRRVLRMCSCMCSCISMSALWIHCKGSYCVCVLASAIWHADLEGQCRNYWYRRATCGHVKSKLNTACLPDTNGNLCMTLSSICVSPLLHILDVIGVFGRWLIQPQSAVQNYNMWFSTPTTNYCEGHKVLQRHMFSI